MSLNFNANQGQPSKRFDNALQGEVWLVNELAGHKNAVILTLVLHNCEAGGENGICGLDRAYARRDGPSSLGNSGN